MTSLTITRQGDFEWRIEPVGAMRVPGVIFGSAELLRAVGNEQALQQVANVATLPGIVEASYAMPDIHWGYGFPIGGVAATDIDDGGVVSPGGVGFDISCGVRLLTTELVRAEAAPRLEDLMRELSQRIPRGLGAGAIWHLADEVELARVLAEGARFAVARGHGTAADLEHCEDSGMLAGADVKAVSDRALLRGLRQLGSLGAGNHFLEVQFVDEVFDEVAASAFGLQKDGVTVLIHSGSRGLGHQICTDHVHSMLRTLARYDYSLPDRQLACAPATSPEGRQYLAAMGAAANYARANRQLLAAEVREAFRSIFGGTPLALLYDVSHNLAKIERHVVGLRERQLCVHRKGATRALPPDHLDLPSDLRPHGQPVLVPGSMGTASYVLAGVDPGRAFHSTCHGAGRVMSRTAAKRHEGGREVLRTLRAEGVVVYASPGDVAEEAPFAYKDVDEVVLACEMAGLARRVARLRPLGVIKG